MTPVTGIASLLQGGMQPSRVLAIGTGSSSRANQLPCSRCARVLVIRTVLAGLLLGDDGPLPGRLHGEDEPVHGSTLMPQLSLAL
jgi:hypothetical protein